MIKLKQTDEDPPLEEYKPTEVVKKEKPRSKSPKKAPVIKQEIK